MDEASSSLYRMVEALVEDNKERIGSIQSTVKSVADEVHSLSKVLILGNGQPPLTNRVVWVEKQVQDTDRDLQELKQRIDNKENKKEDRSWSAAVLLISTLVSLLTALANIVLNHHK